MMFAPSNKLRGRESVANVKMQEEEMEREEQRLDVPSWKVLKSGGNVFMHTFGNKSPVWSTKWKHVYIITWFSVVLFLFCFIF